MTSQPCVVQLRLYQKRLTVSPWEKRWYCCCFVKIFKIAHLTKITATHIVAVKQGREDVTKFEEPLILTASTCAHCVVGGEVINHRVQASVTLGGVEKVCVLVNVWVHGWNKVLVWFSLIIHRLTSPVRFGNEGGPWMTFQQWNLSVCGCLSPMGRVGKGGVGFKLYEVVKFSSQMLIDVYLSKHILKLRSEVFLSDEWGQVHSFHMQQVTTGQFACIAECYSVFFLSILLNFLPTSNKDSYFCALKSDFSSVLMPKSTFFVAILWKSVIPYFPYHLTYYNCDVISPSGSTLHCATLPVKMPACAVLVFPSFITLWNAYGLLGQKEVISRCQGGLYNGQEKLYLNPK